VSLRRGGARGSSTKRSLCRRCGDQGKVKAPFVRLHVLSVLALARGVTLQRDGGLKKKDLMADPFGNIDDEALKNVVADIVADLDAGNLPAFLKDIVADLDVEDFPAVQALYFFLADHSKDHCQMIVELAGPDAAFKIAKAYARYRRDRVLSGRPHIKKKLDRAIAAAEELQRLRLTPLDFYIWGLNDYVPEELCKIGPRRIVDSVVDLLKRSPLASRSPGRPRDQGRKDLAVEVAWQLRAAGVPVTKDPAGALSETLGLLLGIESPDRLVKHAVKTLEIGIAATSAGSSSKSK